MSKDLPRRPSLGSLRKQAKALVRDYRNEAADAQGLVREYFSGQMFATLRDAQFVISRKYGFKGWSDLCRSVGEAVDRESPLAERADLFADLACLTYFGNDHVTRRERAAQLLAESPELAQVSCYAAATAFDCEALAAHLADRPTAATESDGPRDWPPLLYLCYSRVAEAPPQRDAVVAARALLSAGARADSFIEAEELGGWRWAGLTGVMGEGEQGLLQQPPHSRARALAELLLDAGADPNDAQGLYNTMFTPGNEWLELLLARGLGASAPVHSGMDTLPTLNYQLSQAVKRGDVDRVELLLEHGADATAKDSYDQRSNYENAVLSGSPIIAALLLEHGAVAIELTRADRFRAAVIQGDVQEAQVLLLEEVTLIEQPKLLIDAVYSPAAIKLLLDLGADPNATDGPGGRVALHEAAWDSREEVIELLLDAGASCDIREGVHQATPIGFANHAGHFKTRDRLLDVSRDVFELSYYGRADQLAFLLGEVPSLAVEALNGRTPLHGLGEVSERVVELLFEHGADVNGLSVDGDTPLDCALASGNQTAAAVLRLHGGVEGRRQSQSISPRKV